MKEIAGLSTSVQLVVHRLNSLAEKSGIYNALHPILRLLIVAEQFVEGIDDSERYVREERTVSDLLLRIRDWLFEVSDLIDEVELEVQSRLQQPGGISLSRLLPFSEESRLVSAANEIQKRLDLIVRDMSKFQFLSGAKSSNLDGTSIIDKLEVIGRESDNMEIQNAILDHVAAADSGVLVIGILGIKGIGKSTLAKLIYDHQHKNPEFDSKLWSAVADKSWYDILRGLTSEVTGKYVKDTKSLDKVEKELRELLDMKRVFLVLDDMLPQSSLSPERVYGLLRNSAHGSVFILTTWSRQVALAFRASMIHELRLLSHDDAYQLFTRFVGGRNGPIQPAFQESARKFVKLSHGHPLALRMIAELLFHKRSLFEWIDLLERTGVKSCMGEVFNYINDGVPPHLKLPFCTLAMQQVFSVEEFICVWMALGFVHSDDPNEQPECIGRKYLRELYDYLLLVDVEYAPGGVLTDFRLHDLVNDVSTNISFEQGFKILRQDDVSKYVDNTIRYLVLEEDCLADTNFLEKLPYMEELQLFVLCPGKQTSGKSLMKKLFRQSNNKSLRVLGLGGCGIEILPNFIGQLKHLRYLDVGRNELLSTLPDSICNLWHLQTLLLHGCRQLKMLPAGIGKLQNLRYLTLTTLQETLQEELGQLTSLRTLALSSCQCLISLPCSLKNLKKLQTLGIVDCPRVDLLASSSVEALEGMDDICSLLLSGVPEFHHLPPILGTPSVAMKHLLIQFSTKLSGIAWLDQFLSLRSLTIEDCPELSTLEVDGNYQFTHMTELVIRKCPQLGDTKWVRQFVSLRSFIIDDCPELAALDAGFTELKKLERLEIRRCRVLISRIEMDSSYISHVQVVELNGVPLNRSKFKNAVQQDDSHRCSTMDIASSSNHVMLNSLSASDISEEGS